MISVVIPLYNKALTIKQCLNSVISQSDMPDELIIINDGSKDDSLEIVKKWIKVNTHIKSQIIDQSNHGVSYSRNKGVALARNNYVAFLDADDMWHEDFLYYMKQVIVKSHDISLVTCKHMIVDETLGAYMPQQSFGIKEIGIIKNYCLLARYYPIVNSSKVIVNKFYFEKVGGFPKDAKVSEDLFLWIKLSECAPIGYCNKLLVTINQAADNSRDSRIGHVPYPITYYSSSNYLGVVHKDLYFLLWSIHFKHVLGSLATKKKEAFIRIFHGLNLFKLRGFFLFPLLLIPKFIFEKIRISRRKKLVKRYGQQ